MPISKWMDKKAVVHIHNGVLLSHSKEYIELILMRWMKLEPIIQSEVSQKEKHQYSIITVYIIITIIINNNINFIYMEFRKMVMITLYERQQKRHRCIEQSFGLCGRGWGWDGLGEWHLTCIITYVKRIASPGSMHVTGCSGLVHWDDLEGWDGEGGGKGVQDGGHMYTCGWFVSMYGKSHYNVVISLQLK